MKPFGKEFWVETSENEIYKIIYPCLSAQACWEKSVDIPSNITEGNYLDLKISDGGCNNGNFVYPLFHKIMTCLTSRTFAADASPWTVSLALTDDNKLWIWDKPWESPYTVLSVVVSSAVIGIMIGLFACIFFLGFQMSKGR